METDLILSAGRSETMSEVKYLPWFILCFTTRLLVEHIGDDGSKILLSFSGRNFRSYGVDSTP